MPENFTFDIPAELKLPTFYEVRRLAGTVEAMRTQPVVVKFTADVGSMADALRAMEQAAKRLVAQARFGRFFRLWRQPRSTAFDRWRRRMPKCPTCSHGARLEIMEDAEVWCCPWGHTHADEDLRRLGLI